MQMVERSTAIKAAVGVWLCCAALFLNLTVASAQQSDRPSIWNVGDAVVTGFSGTIAPDPSKPLPANKSALDLTFINPDGTSARIIDLALPGFVWDGRVWNAPKKFNVLARDVGQVFGAAVDDEQAPNVYLTATSAFGLRLIVPARDGSGTPERTRTGQRGATWMQGQFGLDRGGGPGSIWKVDGRTGQLSLFANVTLDGAANAAAGLGNVAYDAARKQLFVSDLATGMIHRFDMSGKDLGRYDHGVTGRRAARQREIPLNRSARVDITSSRFDSENPDTWGLAQPERRVWGLTVYKDRLYYSVWAGPQIWSVGIGADGNFANDARWELDVENNPSALPVSDMIFSNQGAMILAQRGGFASSYDYSAFTRSLGARVLQYVLEQPDDPRTPSRWIAKPREYAVGFPADYRNTNGGVALGYGYGRDGRIDPNSCESSIWITGENLRNDVGLRDRLEPGGPLVVHGIQGSDSNAVRDATASPWASYFVDYDDKFDDPRASGHIGVVRINRVPCTGPMAAYRGPGGGSAPGGGGGGGGGGDVCVIPPGLPTNLSLPPLSLPPCTRPGQPVSLDLSTASAPGVDPNWTVAPAPWGPHPFHTSFWNWTVNAGNWVQPAQSATVVDHPIRNYIYTRTFNLGCRPEAYRSLKLSGNFGSDNNAVMTLNGPANVVASCTNCYNTIPVTFAHTGPGFFVPGLNTLTVTVTNRPPGGPTGLSLIGKLEAICGPDCVCGCPPGTEVVDGQCVPTKPIDLTIGKENTAQGGSGTWFNLWVTNVGAPITFPAGGLTVTDAIPAGMTVTNLAGTGPGWTCGPPPPPPLVGPATLTCTYNLAGSLGTGQSIPASIIVHYTTTGPGPFQNCATIGASPAVGTDTNPANNTACVTVTPTPGSLIVKKVVEYTGPIALPIIPFPMTVTCTPSGFTASFNLTNGGSYTVNNVPAGDTCTVLETLPPPPNVCPLPNVAMWFAPTYTPPSVVISGGPPATITVHNAFRCLNLLTNNPDLAIEKTGGTSPVPQVNAYAFHLKVTNVGASFNGNNVITVTDVVPAGMTFNTASGPNWTCATLPVSAGGTMTCTYTGPGPTAPNQSLGTIDVAATASGTAPFPPFRNCATAGLTPASGLVDGNPSNNTSCVMVTKPPLALMCDPRTTIKRGNECACRYPGMVQSSQSACMCAPRTNLIPGRGCVRPIECRPPMIPNAAGTTCLCPRGMEMVRGRCEPRERPDRRENDLPRIGPRDFPGGGFPGGGGGQPGGGSGRR